MFITILGKRWRLRFTNLKKDNGDCDAPDVKNKEIRVRSNLKGELRLETIIHECLHAADWHKDESYIEQKAIDLARILWRLGYRQLPDKEPHDGP